MVVPVYASRRTIPSSWGKARLQTAFPSTHHNALMLCGLMARDISSASPFPLLSCLGFLGLRLGHDTKLQGIQKLRVGGKRKGAEHCRDVSDSAIVVITHVAQPDAYGKPKLLRPGCAGWAVAFGGRSKRTRKAALFVAS